MVSWSIRWLDGCWFVDWFVFFCLLDDWLAGCLVGWVRGCFFFCSFAE
jgi:hypothetical protein